MDIDEAERNLECDRTDEKLVGEWKEFFKVRRM